MSDFRLDSNDLGLVAVVLIWGFNLPVVKIALRHFEPLSFNAVRFVLAALLLLLLLLRRRDGSPRTSLAGRSARGRLLAGA